MTGPAERRGPAVAAASPAPPRAPDRPGEQAVVDAGRWDPNRLPEIPGPVETLGIVWRWLRRMSTALLLLFAQVVASVVGTLVPQEPLIPSTVAEWRDGTAGPGQAVATVFDRLGFFDVYGSWWFAAITVLLFVSLTGCLVPRWVAFARNARRRPDAGRNLDRLSNRVVLRTDRDPEAALDAAEAVLRRRRFRRRRVPADATDSGAPRLAGERGHAREGGSLVFHSAFYLLLAGAVVGQAFGFHGQINMAEGSAFADTRLAYDLAEPGRYFELDDHRGFVVTLDDFTVRYYENFTASDYVSTVTISEDGAPVRTEQVRVNHPLVHDGMKLYQARFGMAPRVVVRAGDTVLFDEPVMLSDAGGFVWTGVAKVSMGDPQIALDLVFLPDAGIDDQGVPYSSTPEPRNPWLIADLYVGEDLGLTRNVPPSEFDRDAGTRLDPPAMVTEGGEDALAAGNLTIEFPELTMWSGFQVSHAPGRWLLLVAGAALLVGLLPSLYSYRRRVWVEAVPGPGGARVTLAGVALQRRATFTDEFGAVADGLRKALDARDDPDATEAPEPQETRT